MLLLVLPLLLGCYTTAAETVEFVVTAGGGAYIINGTSNPVLTLLRGSTYNFSNSVVGSHPLFIKTSTVNGGTADQFNNGVSGQGGALVQFRVPHDAPDVLFYQCSIHSGLKGNLTIVSPNLKAPLCTNSTTGLAAGAHLNPLSSSFQWYKLHDNLSISWLPVVHPPASNLSCIDMWVRRQGPRNWFAVGAGPGMTLGDPSVFTFDGTASMSLVDAWTVEHGVVKFDVVINCTDNHRLLWTHFDAAQSYTYAYFQRYLKAADRYDLSISSAGSTSTMFAVGSTPLLSYHGATNRGVKVIDYRSSPTACAPDTLGWIQLSDAVWIAYEWTVDPSTASVPVLHLWLRRNAAEGWMGFGFGTEMLNSDIMVVTQTTNGAFVVTDATTRSTTDKNEGPSSDISQGGTSDVEVLCSQVDSVAGYYTVKISRRAAATDRHDATIARQRDTPIIFAWGNARSSSYHGGNRLRGWVDFSAATSSSLTDFSTTSATVYPRLYNLHGLTMSFIWLLCVPFSVIVTRFGRIFPAWASLHQQLMTIAINVTLPVVASVLVESGSLDTTHSKLGVVVLSLTIAQLVLGSTTLFYWQHKAHAPVYRKLIRSFHIGVGACVSIIGAVTAVLGSHLLLPEYKTHFNTYISVLGAILIILEVRKHWQTKTARHVLSSKGKRAKYLAPGSNKGGGAGEKTFVMDEVESRGYIVFEDGVYDVKDFYSHPGGGSVMKSVEGKRVDDYFYGTESLMGSIQHAHSFQAVELLAQFRVGRLVSDADADVATQQGRLQQRTSDEEEEEEPSVISSSSPSAFSHTNTSTVTRRKRGGGAANGRGMLVPSASVDAIVRTSGAYAMSGQRVQLPDILLSVHSAGATATGASAYTGVERPSQVQQQQQQQQHVHPVGVSVSGVYDVRGRRFVRMEDLQQVVEREQGNGVLSTHWYVSAAPEPRQSGKPYTLVPRTVFEPLADSKATSAASVPTTTSTTTTATALPFLRFMIKRYAKGAVSRAVCDTAIGTPLFVSGPVATLKQSTFTTPLVVFAAQGTGVLGFLGALEAFADGVLGRNSSHSSNSSSSSSSSSSALGTRISNGGVTQQSSSSSNGVTAVCLLMSFRTWRDEQELLAVHRRLRFLQQKATQGRRHFRIISVVKESQQEQEQEQERSSLAAETPEAAATVEDLKGTTSFRVPTEWHDVSYHGYFDTPLLQRVFQQLRQDNSIARSPAAAAAPRDAPTAAEQELIQRTSSGHWSAASPSSHHHAVSPGELEMYPPLLEHNTEAPDDPSDTFTAGGNKSQLLQRIITVQDNNNNHMQRRQESLPGQAADEDEAKDQSQRRDQLTSSSSSSLDITVVVSGVNSFNKALHAAATRAGAVNIKTI